MPRETETKFKIKSGDTFRKALKKISAEFISKEFEQDTYYRSPSRGFAGSAIRLRAIGGKGVFTVKSACRAGLPRAYKVREELEAGVNDVKAFGKILVKLGFTPRFRKEKIRETYKWKNAKICVDELPFIGLYAEIEAPKKRIKEAADLLGLKMACAMPETYMELFSYYKALRRKPHLKLVFERRPRV